MKKFVFLLITLGFLLSACGGSVDLTQPPEILYGEDVCIRCDMIISEARFAAGYSTNDGEFRIFDDIGGMFAYVHEKQEDIAVFWVHDYETAEWIEAEAAFYVVNENVYTPMSFGAVAFSDEATAKNFATENQTMVMSFADTMASFGGEMQMNHEHD